MGDWFIPAVGVILFGGAIAAYLVTERRLRRLGYRREAPTPTGPLPRLEADATTFRGGARMGRWNASTPVGRIELDDAHAVISAEGLAVLGATRAVGIDRTRVDGIQPVDTPLGSGIRFASADGVYDSIVFWTGLSEDTIRPVLAAFRERGWPVTTD